MRPIFFLFCLLSSTSAADALDEAKLQKLVGLICNNGGYIYEEAAAALLPNYGYTKEEVLGLEAELLERGMIDKAASVEKGALVLIPAACS